MEEAFVFALDRSARYVPAGCGAGGYALTNSLEITVRGLVEVGEVKLIEYTVNNANRALEAVLEWDISALYGEAFSVTLEEEWWKGGHSGATVLGIDNVSGSVAGIYSGQHGFVSLPGGVATLHPTLQKFL